MKLELLGCQLSMNEQKYMMLLWVWNHIKVSKWLNLNFSVNCHFKQSFNLQKFCFNFMEKPQIVKPAYVCQSFGQQNTEKPSFLDFDVFFLKLNMLSTLTKGLFLENNASLILNGRLNLEIHREAEHKGWVSCIFTNSPDWNRLSQLWKLLSTSWRFHSGFGISRSQFSGF